MTDTTTTPPATGGTQPSKSAISQFLSAFRRKKAKKDMWTMSPGELLKSGDLQNLMMRLGANGFSDSELTTFRKDMITSKKGRKTLVRNPDLAVELLSKADAADLDDTFFKSLGAAKNDILSNALVRMMESFEPALFAKLSGQIPKDVWNDANIGLGQKKRGLGPNVLAGLFENGAIDEICDLIDKGVETHTAAQSTKSGGSAYSGFVMPLEHIVQKDLHNVAKLDTKEAGDWSDKKLQRVKGAKIVLAKLEEVGTAQAVSSWQDVLDSELVAEYQKHPGTIWGFEYLREPFVEAAHSTKKGDRPIRMIELWDAVKGTLSAKQYEDFLADPKTQIDTLVNQATDVAKDGLKAVRENPQKVFTGNQAPFEKFKLVPYDDKKFRKKFLKNLEADARTFLENYAKHLPRGSMSRKSLDDPSSSVSKISGVDEDKFMGSAACKAGLYCARDEGNPVYYCLDGINMEDATDYKKVKNKAIEEYLDPDQNASSFKEVITMKEVREILRSWDDLKFPDGTDVVKFVRKGKIMSANGAKDFVGAWQKKMSAANKEAGRRPAPERAKFAKELAAIDPELPARLDAKARAGTDEKTVDMDARDIVRKAGYLLRVSNTNPEFVVKYLMSKCDILVDYDLIPVELVTAALEFGKLAYSRPPASKAELIKPANAVKKALKSCAKEFSEPLAKSLVQHPSLEHSKRLAKLISGA